MTEHDTEAPVGGNEARFLVDYYYALQDFRIQAGNELKAASKQGEDHAVAQWLAVEMARLEHRVARQLDAYSDADPLGRWARSLIGVGPILAAGLLAHIDISKAPSPSSVWRFAGLDPTAVWNKGEKRPWNGRLKVIAWKLGESFVKTKNHPRSVYGRLYDERRAYEEAQNAAGAYADQAAAMLKRARWKDGPARTAYEAGRLPDGHLHARCKRYAVKIFLSHYYVVGYRYATGKNAPRAYALEHLGHVHEIPVPNWPFDDESSS